MIDFKYVYTKQSYLGSFLFYVSLKKKDDFQDYKLWGMLKYLNKTGKTIIVPIGITNGKYYEKIVG